MISEEVLETVRARVEKALSPLVGRWIHSSTDEQVIFVQSVLESELNSIMAEGLVPPRFLICGTYPGTQLGDYEVRISQNFAMYPMDADYFKQVVGREPVQDDLHRVNCDQARTIGHYQCGWCLFHETPRFECGCLP